MFNGVGLFKKLSFGKKIQLSIIAIILGIMVLAPMVAAAGNPNPGVVPVDSKFFGKTYGDWSEEWWKWALSIPADRNPLLDTTGDFCAERQSGNVWFLAGTLGETGVVRNCEVPFGKALFFPIINSEASIKEKIYGSNEEELRASVKSDIDKVTFTEVTVDDTSLTHLNNYRVGSDLFVFWLPKNNILGLTVPPHSSKAVTDGYWIMLKPLSAGQHVIHIHGKAKMSETFTFETEVTYNLNVVPKK
jgi:hypothetical protein